jgi:hypothetical protein
MLLPSHSMDKGEVWKRLKEEQKDKTDFMVDLMVQVNLYCIQKVVKYYKGQNWEDCTNLLLLIQI